ncbi:hypothetical protein Tco_1336155 [Tanacetum coccineum]
MDSYSIQENVESLQLIPQQQPGVEEEQLDMQIMPVKDHVDASATLERLSNFKASQLTNSVRHTSLADARFISLILEKALGDSYVLSDEIGLKIPIMDVAGILLCDNVSDGSPSIDTNLNEIVQKSYIYFLGSGDESLKDDCPVNSNQVCNYQNNVASFQEDVVGDIIVGTGSGENLKDGCAVNSNEVRNYQNNSGDQILKDGCDVNSNKVCNYQNNGGDENLKDGCHVNSNEICNYQNNGGDENLKDGCLVNSNEVCNYHNDGGSFHEVQTESNLFATMVSKQVSPAQSFENLIHKGDDIMNVDCDDECENQGNNAFVEDVDKSSLNQLVLTVLIDHIRLLSNQVTSLVNEQVNLKDMVNKLITSPVPSTEALVAEVVKCVNASFSSLTVEIKNGIASGKKEIKDEVNELKKSLLSKSSTYDITKEVIFAIEPELKNIKDHIIKIETLSFPSKESLVAEDSSLPKTSIEDISKAVFALIKPELKTFIQSVTDLFSKTKVNIHVPEDFTMAKSICVDDSTSIAKTIVAYEEAPLKQAEFDKDFLELPLDPESNVIPTSTIQEPTSSILSEDVCHERPQTETSSHLVVAEIHTTYAQKEGKQHIVIESSNKNDEICDNVTTNPTSSDGSLSHKPDDIFRYEAGGVEHNKASNAEVLRVIEEEERSLQIQKNSAIRAEEDKQLQIKFKNRKLLYDRYVRAVNPQCRFLPQKITVVDILSRKGPISVMVFREGSLNFKIHNPLNLRKFNYDEWMEIKKCMVMKMSKQAKIILDNIEYRVKELSKIKKSLGLVSGVPLSELDPMIEYHGLLNKRKLDDIEKEGSFVSGMDCDLSIPYELVNKDLADGQVLYEPEFGMFFKNRYRDSHVMSAEKEFIRLVEVAIEEKNVEYPANKRIKLERMDIM